MLRFKQYLIEETQELFLILEGKGQHQLINQFGDKILKRMDTEGWRRYGYDHYNQKGDTEGIVNYGLTIKGINFTAIFIEHSDENIIKISFRSQGSFDVNAFAREHFCGGGHINAAGGKSYDTLKATTDKFEKLISKITI